ncbi:MAG: hypothetical protein QM739_03935 [Propionivibrio sp.]
MEKAMRIPAEALPSIMNGIDGRAKDNSAERQRPEPVDRLADLRPRLDQSSPGERSAAGNEEALRRAIMAANKGNTDAQGWGERRKTERRKMKQPIFLDTRLTRSRRQDALEATIDFEV